MSPTTEPKRLPIPDHLLAHLSEEVQKIKQKGAHFKVNEAKMVVAIVEIFLDRHLEKDRSLLEAKFFDKKTYLKALIDKSESDADLSSSLNEFLGVARKKPSVSKSKTEPVAE